MTDRRIELTSKEKASTSSTPPSALNSVVSKLMRAAAGGVPANIPDEDLDRYIADTILKEAAAANKRYQEIGIGAFVKNKLPKTNKRFLASVIRNTDTHNESLLKKEREEAEERFRDFRRERRGELVSDSRDRRRGRRHEDDRRRGDRSGGRRRDESRGRSYSVDYGNETPIRSPDRSYSSERRDRAFGSRSRSRSRTPERRRRSPSSSSPDNRYEKRGKTHKVKTSNRKEQSSTTPNRTPPPSTKQTQSTTSSSALQPARIKRGRGEIGSSRLDKFFREGYDPGLDFDNYDDDSLAHYVARLEDLAQERFSSAKDEDGKRKKKRKKEKKSKSKKEGKRKRDKGSSSSESSDEEERRRESKRVQSREVSRSLSPDMRSSLPATCPW